MDITGNVTSPHLRWGIGARDFATQDDKPYLSFDYESLKYFAQLVFSFGSHAVKLEDVAEHILYPVSSKF